jgi:hypothetical protein
MSLGMYGVMTMAGVAGLGRFRPVAYTSLRRGIFLMGLTYLGRWPCSMVRRSPWLWGQFWRNPNCPLKPLAGLGVSNGKEYRFLPRMTLSSSEKARIFLASFKTLSIQVVNVHPNRFLPMTLEKIIGVIRQHPLNFSA